MTLDEIKAIGDKHALGVPDRTRFNPTQRYVEDVMEHLLKGGPSWDESGAPVDDLEQRIERVVADRLADVYERLNAVEAELQRRKGGRPPKTDG
jgi:hypothetical protein